MQLFTFYSSEIQNKGRRPFSVFQDHEYLSALTSLSQEPGSPEVRKPAVMRESDSKEYAQLVGYSIVIDVRSAV